MNSLLIIVLIFILLGLLFIIPTLINMLRAKFLGLNLSFNIAWRLTQSKVVNNNFLKVMSGFKQNDISFQMNDLITQKLAGGDLENCLNGLIYAKQNGLDAKFKTISVIDLAGKNVTETLKDSNKIYEVRITGLQNTSISIDYWNEYKYPFQSFFIDKDEEKIKSRVSEKINNFLNSWTSDNEIEAEQMLRSNILNSDYWENNLRIVVINQKYTISKKHTI